MKKGSKFVNTGDRVMILKFCTFSDNPLSMYHVSFNSLLYLQRYTANKFFMPKIKKENNSVNTVDMVMILAFCTYSDGPLLMYQV